MKIKKSERVFDIPWRDGAVLKVDVAHLQDVVAKYPDMVGARLQSMAVRIAEESIIGWTGIEDQDGKAIKFSEDMRRDILEMVLADENTGKRLMTAITGPLGNLTAGLTASSNGNGIPASAANASAKTDASPAKEGKGAASTSKAGKVA